MAYDYSSESKLLELPNPYQLQNRVLWLCAAILLAAGITSLFWAQGAMQQNALRLVAAPLLAGVAMLAAAIVCGATAARRIRFFFGRGRPASLAPEIPVGATGGSPAADHVKELLRQGGLTYPEPQGAIEGLLYHWAPTLITAPREVQEQARRYVFNLAAIGATLLSFVVSYAAFGTPTTRPCETMGLSSTNRPNAKYSRPIQGRVVGVPNAAYETTKLSSVAPIAARLKT